jgi:hypothetical protein
VIIFASFGLRSDPHDEGKEKEVDVPVEEMLFIRDNLTRAESARRHGETTQVYDCYNNLARYFQVQIPVTFCFPVHDLYYYAATSITDMKLMGGFIAECG